MDCGKHLEIHVLAGKLLINWGIPMEIPAWLPRHVRIGDVSPDVRAGELNHGQDRTRLGQHSLQILLMLLDRPGEVVTREELARKLWPEDTYVDFADGLNHAIRKLREALGDSPETPRFIETVPRRGYRLVAPVGELKVSGSTPLLQTRAEPDDEATAWKNWRRFVFATGILLFIGFSTLIALNVAGLRDRIFGKPFPRIESIAVLPLENLSADPQQEYFADGMTEELITTLGQISALRVISRTSVMRYKRTRKPLPEIARELHVDAIVEGTVQRSGNRVRVTANLLHAQSDHHLWAKSYERNLGDILTLQDEVARAIADQIKAKLTTQQQVRLTATRPVNPEALESYLKGRFYWNNLSPKALEVSLHYFERSLEKDPGFALGYAGIAEVWHARNQMRLARPSEAARRVKAAAARALALDKTLAEVHLVLANQKKSINWDWNGAEAEFRQAIELNPNNAEAHAFYSHLLFVLRRPDEGLVQGSRALALDPYNPLIQTLYGIDLIFERRFDDALVLLRQASRLAPGIPMVHTGVHAALYEKHLYHQAYEGRKAWYVAAGDHEMDQSLARGYAEAGYEGAMSRAAETLAHRATSTYVQPIDIAEMFATANRKEKSIYWLEEAFKRRDPALPYIAVIPLFDGLHSDPRYQDIVRRMHFPPQTDNPRPSP
jgi:TolB-like protein/DNA-binding winged helix-turn-helix (wHTH) protein